jgi:hypothetical protein
MTDDTNKPRLVDLVLDSYERGLSLDEIDDIVDKHYPGLSEKDRIAELDKAFAFGSPDRRRALRMRYMQVSPKYARLEDMIVEHGSSLSTYELVAFIRSHRPTVPVVEILAEIRRQAELDKADAEALKEEGKR